MTDWNAAKFWLDLIALALAVGAWIYAWRIKHDRFWEDRLDVLRAALDKEKSDRIALVADLRQQLDRAAAQIDGAPSGQALHELALANREIAGELKALSARFEGLAKIVERLESITDRQEDFLRGPTRS